MNRKSAGILLLVGIGVAALFSLWGAPVSLIDLLKQPLQSLWGSPQRLQTELLEVSENVGSVQDATKKLLQPLGALRLIRRFPGTNPPDSAPRARTPESPNSSKTQNP